MPESISAKMQTYLMISGEAGWYMDEARTISDRATYCRGMMTGLMAHAWWKDGIQYVGSTGTTLAEAIDVVKAEVSRLADLHVAQCEDAAPV